MTQDKTPTEALAQLRHLYVQLKSQDGMSRTDRARIADGILSPAIAALEKWGQPAQAQADSVQEDAARYRWLREQSSTLFVNISINGEGAEIAETLDSAVDAARKQGASQ